MRILNEVSGERWIVYTSSAQSQLELSLRALKLSPSFISRCTVAYGALSVGSHQAEIIMYEGRLKKAHCLGEWSVLDIYKSISPAPVERN
jgi:hypothetical protein